MRPAVYLLAPALLALGACGKSDSANEAAQADTVEMPAEEAMGSVAAEDMPIADPNALPGADASLSPAPEPMQTEPMQTEATPTASATVKAPAKK
ncbi:hypothetical protein ACOYW6_08855 [Parablastomonas sp. CN1-191]|uniref:hypothetical protein n=1 Tax=Parablastomonas sp. CN1-191 TaxID=3400908 RepID=UPI003BF88B3C